MDGASDDQDRADLEAARAQLAGMSGALGLAAQLSDGIVERSGLDLRTFHLVRAAALAASGSPPVAWQVNLEVMDDHVSVEDIEGMLVAILPIVGTSRYLDAVAHIVEDD